MLRCPSITPATHASPPYAHCAIGSTDPAAAWGRLPRLPGTVRSRASQWEGCEVVLGRFDVRCLNASKKKAHDVHYFESFVPD